MSTSNSYIGCDICDAFTIVNGFNDEEELRVHTKDIHGKVRITLSTLTSC